MDWRVINGQTPRGESLIAWGPGWINAGEVVRDKIDGLFYSPDSGADFEPQPTHWMPMPPPPE